MLDDSPIACYSGVSGVILASSDFACGLLLKRFKEHMSI